MTAISDGRELEVIPAEEYHDPEVYELLTGQGYTPLRLTRKFILWTEVTRTFVQGELFGGKDGRF